MSQTIFPERVSLIAAPVFRKHTHIPPLFEAFWNLSLNTVMSLTEFSALV
jgi:hypothetical protein